MEMSRRLTSTVHVVLRRPLVLANHSPLSARLDLPSPCHDVRPLRPPFPPAPHTRLETASLAPTIPSLPRRSTRRRAHRRSRLGRCRLPPSRRTSSTHPESPTAKTDHPVNQGSLVHRAFHFFTMHRADRDHVWPVDTRSHAAAPRSPQWPDTPSHTHWGTQQGLCWPFLSSRIRRQAREIRRSRRTRRRAGAHRQQSVVLHHWQRDGLERGCAEVRMPCFPDGPNALMIRSLTAPSLFSIILISRMLVDAENPSLSHSILLTISQSHNRKYPHQSPLLSSCVYLLLPVFLSYTECTILQSQMATHLESARNTELVMGELGSHANLQYYRTLQCPCQYFHPPPKEPNANHTTKHPKIPWAYQRKLQHRCPSTLAG